MIDLHVLISSSLEIEGFQGTPEMLDLACRRYTRRLLKLCGCWLRSFGPIT